MRYLYAFLLLACSTCLVSCLGNMSFHEFKHLSHDEWNWTDTLEYVLSDSTLEGEYECFVSLRLTPDYPFRELWIAAETDLSHPTYIKRDTIRLAFEEESLGIFRKGVNLSQEDCLVGKIPIRKGQTGRIRLYHLMSRETLPCISDVGVWMRR